MATVGPLPQPGPTAAPGGQSVPVVEMAAALARLDTGATIAATVEGGDGAMVRLATALGPITLRTALPLAPGTELTLQLRFPAGGGEARARLLPAPRAAAPAAPQPAAPPAAAFPILRPGAVVTAQVLHPVPPTLASTLVPASVPAVPTPLVPASAGSVPTAALTVAPASPAAPSAAKASAATSPPAAAPASSLSAAAPTAAFPSPAAGPAAPAPNHAPLRVPLPPGLELTIRVTALRPAPATASGAPPPAGVTPATAGQAAPTRNPGVARTGAAAANAPRPSPSGISAGQLAPAARPTTGSTPLAGPPVGGAPSASVAAAPAARNNAGHGAATGAADPVPRAISAAQVPPVPAGARAAGSAPAPAPAVSGGMTQGARAAPPAPSAPLTPAPPEPGRSGPGAPQRPPPYPRTVSVPPAAASMAGRAVTGKVALLPPTGGAILATPVGLLAVSGGGAPAPGGELSFEIVSAGGPRGAPSGGRPVSVLELFRQWPALEEVLPALAGADAAVAAEVMDNRIPQPGPRLAASLLFLVSAFRGGDVQGWLGAPALDLLARAGRGDLVRRLGDEFAQMARLAGDLSAGDWRGYLLPLHDGGQLGQLRLFVRDAPEGDTEEAASTAGKRFLLDFELSRLGAMQLDGIVQERRFHLIVRAAVSLAPDIRDDIARIFEEGCACTGLAGEVVFAPAGEMVELPVARGLVDTDILTG